MGSRGRASGAVSRRVRAERILDAAAELLLRHGYRRITIEDVARHAGIAKGAMAEGTLIA